MEKQESNLDSLGQQISNDAWGNRKDLLNILRDKRWLDEQPISGRQNFTNRLALPHSQPKNHNKIILYVVIEGEYLLHFKIIIRRQDEKLST